MGTPTFDFAAYAMVCFCDIPISRINEHVNFYGSFGIGLSREWGMKNHLSPVLYLSPTAPLCRALCRTIKEASEGADDANKDVVHRNIGFLLAYAKPTGGRMVINGEPVQKEFYQESEWRYVPQHKEISLALLREKFEDETVLLAANVKTQEHGMLPFSPPDVRYLFVPTDAEIPDIINFIQTEMDSHVSADLKVLMSRVTSLESISRDI